MGGLIRVCEITNDNDRLERYMDLFAEQDFANFVFDWHLRQGKQSKLLQHRTYTSGKRQNQLGRFLEGHANFPGFMISKLETFLNQPKR